jgi:hypothetical protein
MNAMELNERLKKMTPGSAIRAFCVSCCGGVFGEVKSCDGDGTDPAYYACPFHPYRMGRGRPSVKNIRKFCLHCMGESPSLVRECGITDCPCRPYRMGKNPARLWNGQNAERMVLVRSRKKPLSLTFGVQDQRSTAG